jgi:hypothetical protein
MKSIEEARRAAEETLKNMFENEKADCLTV